MTTTTPNYSEDSQDNTNQLIEWIKQNIKPAQLTVLAGAGIAIGEFASMTGFYAFALQLGGQVLGTAALLVLIDVIIDVIKNREQLRKDRAFRISWAKRKRTEIVSKTKNVALWSFGIALASIFCPIIPAVLTTMAGCAMFTMGMHCAEAALTKAGKTVENSRFLRLLKDAAGVMTPILGFLHSAVTAARSRVLQALDTGLQWIKDGVMKAGKAIFNTIQKFLAFLTTEATLRFFRSEDDDFPFEMAK